MNATISMDRSGALGAKRALLPRGLSQSAYKRHKAGAQTLVQPKPLT